MICRSVRLSVLFFFNDTATTEIYTLSLHDALPIFPSVRTTPLSSADRTLVLMRTSTPRRRSTPRACSPSCGRSEEHTSELQSRQYLVCRLLLEKKKKQNSAHNALIACRKLRQLVER